MRRMIMVASGINVLLAAPLMTGCSSPEEQALGNAKSMAQSKLDRMRSTVENSFSTSNDQAESFAEARRNVASARRETAEALLDSGRADSSAWFDVTVVTHGDAGGGISAAGITIRMCARITALLSANPVKAQISNSVCPADLPPEIPGFGTIEKIVRYTSD